jgi:hypothetical protein
MSTPENASAVPPGSRRARAPRKAFLRKWIRLSSVMLVALATLSGCGGGSDSARFEKGLGAHIDALCDGARHDGRATHDSAVAYIAGVLEEVGLTPPVVNGEGQAGFVQLVPLVRNLVGDSTRMELRVGRGTKRLPEGRRAFILVAPGDAGRASEFRTPVYVGNGLHAPAYGIDDFEGLDLSGRPVLVSATPPDSNMLARLPQRVREMYSDPGEAQRRKMSDIVDRGATAILLLPDRWLLDEWDALSASDRLPVYRLSEPYPGHILQSPIPIALLYGDLVDRLFLGRPYHPISHVGKYRTFELEGLSLRIDIDVRREPLVTANVVGLVPGSDPSLRDEYVLVTAQLDGGEGGDDGDLASWDAPACATVLEAARMIASEPSRRSVLFAFFVGEVSGTWGALHLLTHPPVPRDGVVATIHIGTGEIPGRRTTKIQALASPPVLARELGAAARRWEVDVRAVSDATRPFRGTPSEVFLDASIPSMLVALGDAGDRRAACDGRIDAKCLLKGAHLVRALVDEAADARRLSWSLRDHSGGGTRR